MTPPSNCCCRKPNFSFSAECNTCAVEEGVHDPAFQAELAGARERSGRLMALLAALLLSLAMFNVAILNLPLLTGTVIVRCYAHLNIMFEGL